MRIIISLNSSLRLFISFARVDFAPEQKMLDAGWTFSAFIFAVCEKFHLGRYPKRITAASLADSRGREARRNTDKLMQHYAEISRDSVCPFLFFVSFFLPSYARLVLPPRLPFRAVSPHPSANYAVVVTSCHVVIKLHLPTTRHDCYQAFDSRGNASSRSAPTVTFRNPVRVSPRSAIDQADV